MVSIAFVDQELTLFYPTKHNTVHSFALELYMEIKLTSLMVPSSSFTKLFYKLTGSFISFSNFIFCISVGLRGTMGFSDVFFFASFSPLSSAIFVSSLICPASSAETKTTLCNNIQKWQQREAMDGRCATVFAAAAAIGASFYVFLAPDGKKKNTFRKGKCHFIP